MSARLRSRLARPAALPASARAQLFAIFSRHYDNADRARFERDLDAKDFVIVLDDAVTGETRGFSSQQVLDVSRGGRPVRAIFSGDTVIDRTYWGEQELVRSWCRFAGRVAAQRPGAPLYWFLITKGFRTYLYLPVFFHAYYPRHDAPTPDLERGLMDALALSKFPRHYDPGTGLISFHGELDRLAPELSRTPAGRLDDPRVSFYFSRNPRWAEGDELVSLTQVCEANMKGLARRMFLEGVSLGPPAQAAVYA